jgi:hypothetical protein
MKKSITKILLTILISMMGTNAYSQDIEVQNADGVTIYYNYINNGTELEVTRKKNDKYKGSVVIPEDVTYMNRTRKVTSIGAYAFYDCYLLTSVTIPRSVTRIGSRAFDACRDETFTSVHISDLEAWCKMDFSFGTNPLIHAHHLFLNGEEIKDLVIPSSVTSIVESAFSGCSGLTSITIPNSVTSIGNYAFRDCSSLTSMKVASDNTVYDSRENCNAIIESSTNTLIAGCNTTTIPNSVTIIGTCTFSGCTSLYSIIIPNSVTTIGEGAFIYCSGLASVMIPNSVTNIGNYAFYDCSSMSSVTIPNSVTSIGEHAFYDWMQIYKLCTRIGIIWPDFPTFLILYG